MNVSANAAAVPEPAPSAAASEHQFVDRVYRFYKRTVSPFLHSVAVTQCRYLPTCSEYGYVAIKRFGWGRGSWLAMRRLIRCHPFCEGGHDPVPEIGQPNPPLSADICMAPADTSMDEAQST